LRVGCLQPHSVNILEIVFTSEVLNVGYYARLLSRRSAQRRAHRIAFHQQLLQHVLADKTSRAGEEDFHGTILNGSEGLADGARRKFGSAPLTPGHATQR